MDQTFGWVLDKLWIVIGALLVLVMKLAVNAYRENKKNQSDIFERVITGQEQRLAACLLEIKALRDDKRKDHDLLWDEAKAVRALAEEVHNEQTRITQSDKDKDSRLQRIEEEMKDMRRELNDKMERLLSRPNGN